MPARGEECFLFKPLLQPLADFVKEVIFLPVDLPAGLVIGSIAFLSVPFQGVSDADKVPWYGRTEQSRG